MQTKKKKPNKAARDKARAERADIYEQGFSHGYAMGLEQGKAEAMEFLDKERRRLAWFGRSR